MHPITRHEPCPHQGMDPVFPELLNTIGHRVLMGVEKYGQPLRTHDGRDHLMDAFQEIIDAAMYLQAAIMEREDDETAEPVPDVHALPEKVVRMWADVHGWLLYRDLDELVEGLTEHQVKQWALQHGYGLALVQQSAPEKPLPEPVPPPLPGGGIDGKLQDLIDYTMSPLPTTYATPSRAATILEAAIAYWEDAHQQSIMTDAKALARIKADLAAASFPPHLHYHSHKQKLHEELPALFPVVPELPEVCHES